MRVDTLHCGHAATATALVEKQRSTTYAELEHLVAATAGGFVRQGVARGDRVAIWLNKTTENVAAMLGVMRAGGVAIPVNPVLKAPQIEHILADSGARLLLTNAARRDTLATGVGVLTIEQDWPALSGGEADAVPCAADDLAAILYTSGSTGRPKGVMLSHRNLCLGAESVAHYLEIGAADRTLCVLPLSFDYGLNQVLTALRQGATAILFDYLLPRDVVRAVALHKATGLAGVPPLWMQLAEVDWPISARQSLRYITNSGGRVPAALSRRLCALLPDTRLFLMYGLTEAFRSTYLDPDLVGSYPDSIGKAIPFAEVRVLRPDGSEAADGEAGELVHSGPLVAKGYWNDAARTAERFRMGARGVEVWSGDTVRRDADGLFYFIGRDDDMIKTSGNRVSPTEVEEALFETGAVSAAAVFGQPDERLGQIIVAVCSPAGRLSSVEAEALVRAQLVRVVPSYMLPRAYYWMHELPRNVNGKIDRAEIRQIICA